MMNRLATGRAATVRRSVLEADTGVSNRTMSKRLFIGTKILSGLIDFMVAPQRGKSVEADWLLIP
jgi:hypothetical protein